MGAKILLLVLAVAILVLVSGASAYVTEVATQARMDHQNSRALYDGSVEKYYVVFETIGDDWRTLDLKTLDKDLKLVETRTLYPPAGGQFGTAKNILDFALRGADILLAWSEGSTKELKLGLIEENGNIVWLASPAAESILSHDSVSDEILMVSDEMRGEIFSATDGVKTRPDFQIIGPGSQPDVEFFTYGNNTPAYMLVYIGAVDTKGTILNRTGDPVPTISAQPFTIASFPGVRSNPKIAFNPSGSRFLVIWEDERKHPGHPDIYGRYVDLVFAGHAINKVNISKEFELFESPDTLRINSLIFNPAANEFVAAYTHETSPVKTSVQMVGANLSKTFEGLENPGLAIYKNPGEFVLFYEKDNQLGHKNIYAIVLDTSLGMGNFYFHPAGSYEKPLLAQDASGKNMVGGNRYKDEMVLKFKDPSSGDQLLITKALFSQGDVDLKDLKIDKAYDKIAADLSATSGLDAKHALVFKNINSENGIFLCPDAKTAAEVEKTCAGYEEFTKPFQTSSSVSQLFGSNIIVLMDQAKANYIVGGLTAGGIGLVDVAVPPKPTALSTAVVNITPDQRQQQFQASYLYNSKPVPAATCSIEFDKDPKGPFTMSYDSQSGKHTHKRNFSVSGDIDYKVSCLAQGHAVKSLSKRVKIEIPGAPAPAPGPTPVTPGADTPPSVTLSKPPKDQKYTDKDTVNFECSASDDNKLSKLALYVDITGKWEKKKEETLNKKTGSLTWSVSGLAPDTYAWSCKATDNASKTAWAQRQEFSVVSSVSGRVCAPEEKRCRGSVMEVCKPDGLSWNKTVCLYKCENTTCTEKPVKPEEGFPWLIILVILIVIGAVAYFFVLPKLRGEETLWDKYKRRRTEEAPEEEPEEVPEETPEYPEEGEG